MILICSKTDQMSLWPNRMGFHLANAPNWKPLSNCADIDLFLFTILTSAPIRRLCRRRGCYAHKRALESKISLGLRPRLIFCPLTPCKTPPYFSNSEDSAPLKFSLAMPLLTLDIFGEGESLPSLL